MSYRDCIKKRAINKLTKDLNLKKDEITQDWEYEMADARRISEFLQYYKENQLSPSEKKLLIQLLLESFNDYMGEFNYNLKYLGELKCIVKNDFEIYKDILDYWACGEDDLEDCFTITPFIREILRESRV